VHPEGGCDCEVLARDGLDRFRNLLRQKHGRRRDREQIARVEQLVLRQVDHHLPLAGRRSERIDLQPVRTGSHDRFARDGVHGRPLRRLRQRVRRRHVPGLEQPRENRHVQVERVDRNAARDVLAHAADVRPRVGRRDHGRDRRASKSLRRVVDGFGRVFRRERPVEDHDAVILFDLDDVPIAGDEHDAWRELGGRALRVAERRVSDAAASGEALADVGGHVEIGRGDRWVQLHLRDRHRAVGLAAGRVLPEARVLDAAGLERPDTQGHALRDVAPRRPVHVVRPRLRDLDRFRQERRHVEDQAHAGAGVRERDDVMRVAVERLVGLCARVFRVERGEHHALRAESERKLAEIPRRA